MRILLLTHTFNCLSQRLYVELVERGHELSVEFDINDRVSEEALQRFRPELILAPYLRRAIPASVWKAVPCIVLHPGIPGDRGPSALDWAILRNEKSWGVTALQANAEFDAGDVWAFASFQVREAPKSSLYRREVTEAAVSATLETLDCYARGRRPVPQEVARLPGSTRPLVTQRDRAIDWKTDSTDEVLRKLWSADGSPGVLDELYGEPFLLFGAEREPGLRGSPGELISACGDAVCRATIDGAVWISHLKPSSPKRPIKLPATQLLSERLGGLSPASGVARRDIRYERKGLVGYLHFAFHNGAASTVQCEALLDAYREALAQPTRVLVLMGGADFWSNGIHLNQIEATESPADESWRNLNAIDDVVKAIVETSTQLTVAAMQGDAGAGGCFLALACDLVWGRSGIVLNPHYRAMGNLYGSEYWTYLLPRRVGEARASQIAELCLPVGSRSARELGLLDDCLANEPRAFLAEVATRAEALATGPGWSALLTEKRARRQTDEAHKPLARYREEELAKARLNFYGFDPSYHVARYNFVCRVPHSRTPSRLAHHRAARNVQASLASKRFRL